MPHSIRVVTMAKSQHRVSIANAAAVTSRKAALHDGIDEMSAAVVSEANTKQLMAASLAPRAAACAADQSHVPRWLVLPAVVPHRRP